ncbi:hypothetical protein P691DRAFT_736132 [Macrolepiota fuliginosa MF-IS2]|uniref:Transmembrane protein n=1 Tax=Macrolepiota fuliginosa MF-IS2 TaxID=1400762 RepID=A0A9P5X8C2_9AGAR|nr:hypothetical protein P691DRAFT_736132 [Macrolepiota fuliginosa MF-IS2]
MNEKTAFGPDVVDGQSGDNEERATHDDVRFSPPPPSLWKRIVLIVAVVLLFYLGFKARAALAHDRKSSVIYASRYSKEHKFRPAASPVITEMLKDGRTRLRGALPTPTATTTPTKAAAKKRRSSRTGRATGKTRRKRTPAVAKQ